jgi:CBS domain-containing protein
VTLRLINQNDRFAAFFYRDISRKLDAAAREEEAVRFTPLMNARVRDLAARPAIFIDAAASIACAGRAMRDRNTDTLFVREGERIGLITGMNLAKAMVLDGKPSDASAAAEAHFDVVSVAPDDFVSVALLKMTRHDKRRIAICDGGAYVGVLEDADLLSFLTGHSRLVAARIDRAATVSELGAAARRIADQTRMLRRQGVKIEVVCEIVSDLNRRLFAKLFMLTAPASIRDSACLMVMGSEGRGEQTMRTDQDNGLILRERVPEADLATFRKAFSGALEGFGFPPCPGGVMVVNPLWSRTIADYRADFRRWLAIPDEASYINVAILYDAESVAGDGELLREIKAVLIDAVKGEQAYLAHFARAIDAFPTPIGLFNNLVTSRDERDALDLKKGGIFPIVHGVRSLALERGLAETGTAARIAALADLGGLTHEFARELTEALRYLMSLRLDGQLAEAALGSLVKPSELSTMERDLLRDAFRVVKQLREIVRRHFNLGIF